MIRRSLTALLPLLLLLAACGDDDGADTASASGSGSASVGSASGSGSHASADEGECEVVGGVDGEDSEIHVSLTEYAIEIEEGSAEGGVVKIEATNEGDVDHELVIMQGAPSALDVNEEGEIDESGMIGEIEPFAPGTECQGSFELEAGFTYTLLCNIVEESGESHYEEGMVAELEVK